MRVGWSIIALAMFVPALSFDAAHAIPANPSAIAATPVAPLELVRFGGGGGRGGGMRGGGGGMRGGYRGGAGAARGYRGGAVGVREAAFGQSR